MAVKWSQICWNVTFLLLKLIFRSHFSPTDTTWFFTDFKVLQVLKYFLSKFKNIFQENQIILFSHWRMLPLSRDYQLSLNNENWAYVKEKKREWYEVGKPNTLLESKYNIKNIDSTDSFQTFVNTAVKKTSCRYSFLFYKLWSFCSLSNTRRKY